MNREDGKATLTLAAAAVMVFAGAVLLMKRDEDRADNHAWSVPRSPAWAKVKAEHLEKHPSCAACGTTDNLEVHHLQDFHSHPELELEPSNLLTLCRKPGHDCHFCIGHLWSYLRTNPHAKEDAARMNKRMREAEEARTKKTSMILPRHRSSFVASPSTCNYWPTVGVHEKGQERSGAFSGSGRLFKRIEARRPHSTKGIKRAEDRKQEIAGKCPWCGWIFFYRAKQRRRRSDVAGTPSHYTAGGQCPGTKLTALAADERRPLLRDLQTKLIVQPQSKGAT